MAASIARIRILIALSLALAAPGVCTSRALAEPGPRVGVILRPRIPASLSGSVVQTLRAHYDVSRIGQSAARKPLRALRVRIAAADVGMVLLVGRQGAALRVEFYDPIRGKRLGSARVSLRGGKLESRGRDQLLAATDRHAAQLYARSPAGSGSQAFGAPPESARPHRGARAAGPLESEADPMALELRDPQRENEAETEPESETEQAPESDAQALGDEPAQEDDEPTAGAEPTTESDEARALAIALSASLGASMRSGEFSSGGVTSRFTAGAAFALGIGLHLTIDPDAATPLRIEGRYTTSIGRQVSELHQDGAALPMGLRSQRLEGGVGPVFTFASPGWKFGPTLGYALRSVAPERHFQLLPFYTLGGPYLRFELLTPSFGPGIGLRLSPELQWLPQASNRAGGSSLGAGRFALAVQLAIRVPVSGGFDIEALLHESHAFAPSDSVEVNDMERFILVNVVFRP